jgi:hypothetical protein
MFAWPMSTIGANWDSRKEGSFKKKTVAKKVLKKKGVLLLLSIKW